MNKLEQAKHVARNLLNLDSDHPYVDDVEFLTVLIQEYEEMEQYELCTIVKARLKLLKVKDKLK